MLSHRKPDAQPGQLFSAEQASDLYDADAMIPTPYGYIEGFFRHFHAVAEEFIFEFDETLNEGTGFYEKQTRTSELTWPKKTERMVPYMPSLIIKLRMLEKELIAARSFTLAHDHEAQRECLFCNFKEKKNESINFSIVLTLAQNKLLIWPSIYKHYLEKHNVVPSYTFAKIVMS